MDVLSLQMERTAVVVGAGPHFTHMPVLHGLRMDTPEDRLQKFIFLSPSFALSCEF